MSTFNAEDVCLLCRVHRRDHPKVGCGPTRVEPNIAALAELERVVTTAIGTPALQDELRLRIRTWARWWVFDVNGTMRIGSDLFKVQEVFARLSLFREVGEKAAAECAFVEVRSDPEPQPWQGTPDKLMRVALLALRSPVDRL